jgi:SAM-dependent methyltransferase
MVSDFSAHLNSPRERERIRDLKALLPRSGTSVLEIGARNGFVTNLLAQHYDCVTALDLQKPEFIMDRVVPVSGDVRHLQFADDSFEAVVCTEVLEHIPGLGLANACREIIRVAMRDIIIGVPYRQDIRLHRTVCQKCGSRNPPWGHVNSFDEAKLDRLFSPCSASKRTYVGLKSARTNAVSTLLQDWAGNTDGTYSQDEGCLHCGAALIAPPSLTSFQKFCTKAAATLTDWQQRLTAPSPIWMHVVYTKTR